MASSLYDEDLALVHIAGYGFHWEQAAPFILETLRARDVRDGLIVDLGCGGGQWLRVLSDAGYDVCGVDASPTMIRECRRLVPEARLVHGSFVTAALPRCRAVTSLGEPLNYTRGKRDIQRVIARVAKALEPGGLFIFDVRVPAARHVAPVTHVRQGEDWACISCTTENRERQTLRREITTFRRMGTRYRRRHATHVLQIYPPDEVERWLRRKGFTVRCYRGYGDYRFAGRQMAFVCRKGAR
jgi:SAM-dependent methyltransferase